MTQYQQVHIRMFLCKYTTSSSLQTNSTPHTVLTSNPDQYTVIYMTNIGDLSAN